jgi:hypothetical protein
MKFLTLLLVFILTLTIPTLGLADNINLSDCCQLQSATNLSALLTKADRTKKERIKEDRININNSKKAPSNIAHCSTHQTPDVPSSTAHSPKVHNQPLTSLESPDNSLDNFPAIFASHYSSTPQGTSSPEQAPQSSNCGQSLCLKLPQLSVGALISQILSSTFSSSLLPQNALNLSQVSFNSIFHPPRFLFSI